MCNLSRKTKSTYCSGEPPNTSEVGLCLRPVPYSCLLLTVKKSSNLQTWQTYMIWSFFYVLKICRAKRTSCQTNLSLMKNRRWRDIRANGSLVYLQLVSSILFVGKACFDFVRTGLVDSESASRVMTTTGAPSKMWDGWDLLSFIIAFIMCDLIRIRPTTTSTLKGFAL